MGVFEHPFICKIEKMKGDSLETLKNLRKKSHKAEETYTKKFWSWAGLEPVLLPGRLQKILQKLKAEEATLVWQLVEASLYSL